jgi:fibronectin-binding autotransporter adhesin
VLVGTDNFSSITVNNGTFRINFSTNANNTNNLVATTSILVNTGGTLALTGTTNIAGPISGDGPILKHGPDTVTLTGDNSGYFGTITLNSGALGIGSNTALGTGPIVINGGILRASGAARVVANLVTANAGFTLGRLTDFANPLTLGAAITITANNFDGAANADSRFNGGITGPFGVTFAEGPQLIGTGALVIAATNTNASTTVASGRVTVEASGVLANGPLIVNGGILNLNNALQDVTSFAGTGGTVNLGVGHILRTTQSADTTYSGVLAGIGGLIKAGPGKLSLTGTNTFSGGATIDGGTLTVNANSGLGAAAAPVLIENDAVLQAGGTLSITTRTINLGPGGGTIDTNGNTVTLAAATTTTGTELTKIGAGKLAILGAQTYDTLTTEGGRTDVGSALGNGSSTINANATTNLGVSQKLAALNIGATGVVTLGTLPPAPLLEEEEPTDSNLIADAENTNSSISLTGDSKAELAETAVQVVPEPGSATLLLLGALSLLRCVIPIARSAKQGFVKIPRSLFPSAVQNFG